MAYNDSDNESDEFTPSNSRGQRSYSPSRTRNVNKGKGVAIKLTRSSRALESRGVSMDVDDEDGTPAGSGAEDEEEDPQSLDEDDMDPINSGAVTPGVGAAPAAAGGKTGLGQFSKRKETKTIKGQVYTVIDDELILEDDPRGEEKIDADGVLLGGRQYKLFSFSSAHRASPNKQYMLSIDAARAAGFRDSLYFFRRNPLIHKLSCTQPEKDRLIAEGKLSGNLKSRAVTMVSARNVYKVMGAAFVLNGKYIFDDYYEDRALAAGHKPGEPAWIETYDPEKDTGTLATAKGLAPAGVTGTGLNILLGHAGKPRLPPPERAGPSAPRDEYITSTVGGSNLAMFGGNGLQPFGKTWDPVAKKARPAAHLSVTNWMHEYAKSVAEQNRELGTVRRLNMGQVKVGVDVVENEEDMWIEVEEEVEDDEEKSTVDGDSAEASTSKLHFGLNGAIDSPAISRSGSISAPRKRKIKVYNPIRGAHDPETNIPHVLASTQPTRSSLERLGLEPQLFVNTGEQEGDDKDGLEERTKKRLKMEKAGERLGIATIVVETDQDAHSQMEDLLPGMWDFRPEEMRRTRW